MALLYEKSKIWRAIVHATRDRRVLALFTVTITGGFSAVAFGLKALTDIQSEKTAAEVREQVQNNREGRRYADHSKRALDAVLKNAIGEEPTPQKYPIKIPGVRWHPKAEAKAKGDLTGAKGADERSGDVAKKAAS